MKLHAIVWRRLGIALTILWLAALAGFTTYEWLAEPPVSGHFVEVVIQKTGEPASSLKGNMFADLVPTQHQLKWKPLFIALLAPVVAIWLIGSLAFWVLSGFVHERT